MITHHRVLLIVLIKISRFLLNPLLHQTCRHHNYRQKRKFNFIRRLKILEACIALLTITYQQINNNHLNNKFLKKTLNKTSTKKTKHNKYMEIKLNFMITILLAIKSNIDYFGTKESFWT